MKIIRKSAGGCQDVGKSWKTMKINENHKEINEKQWASMKIIRRQMKINGKSMSINANH